MTPSLMTLDFKHLAEAELERASHCEDRASRARHLNRAAVYAHNGEKAGLGSTQSVDVLNLVCALSIALDDADALELTLAAVHINQAIIELGGIGTHPSEKDLRLPKSA